MAGARPPYRRSRHGPIQRQIPASFHRRRLRPILFWYLDELISVIRVHEGHARAGPALVVDIDDTTPGKSPHLGPGEPEPAEANLRIERLERVAPGLTRPLAAAEGIGGGVRKREDTHLPTEAKIVPPGERQGFHRTQFDDSEPHDTNTE